MSYIDQTLTDGEIIISSSIFHWWFTAKIFLNSFVVILIGIAILNAESLKDLGNFFGYAIIAVASILALIKYIFALIEKKNNRANPNK